jgi:hypothetical protein
MTGQSLQLESILLGMLLLVVLMLLAALLMLYMGRPILRRLADWLLNRRGFEKLGRSLRVRPVDTPYENWLATAKSKIPVHECLYIDDVKTVPLEPWAQQGDGVRGLYLRLADYQISDGRILEIPSRGATNPARHMFEMAVYFLGGHGRTVIHEEGKPPRQIEWKQRSVYSVPLNTTYQHFNDSEEPVRLLAVTSFPFMLNSTNSTAFISDNPFEFTGRTEKESEQNVRVRTNRENRDFVPNALEVSLRDHSIRGKGINNMYWTMSGNSMIDVNVSEMAGRTIKRAHRSTSDATVLMLSSEGYAVTWPEGAWHKRIRINWHEGTLIAQPLYWYRQFMNPGPSSARNLTISARTLVENLGLRFLDQMENDLPEIRKEWEAELRAQVENDQNKPSKP